MDNLVYRNNERKAKRYVLKILIADDNRMIREMFKEVLIMTRMGGSLS
jgi:hypothetical protein